MRPLTPDEKRYLISLYFNPNNPGSYQGPERLKKAVDEDGQFSITFEQIEDWLQNQEPYSLNRNVARSFQRGRVLVKGIDDQWEADLADMQSYAKDNDNMKYLLFVIDVFSRYLWVEPLKDKTANEVSGGFDAILGDTPRHPRRLRTDAATDFTSNTFQKLLKGENISHFVTHSEKQANYVERVIQTMKKRIFRFMVAQNSEKYIDALPALVESYNNTWHSGIKARPADVDSSNESQLWWQMYWGDEPYDPKKHDKKVRFKYKQGDIVRMTVLRSALQREYTSTWTMELFKISDRVERQGQPIYKLVDWVNDPVQGTFYEYELQRISEPDPFFKVEKILKYKGKGNAKQGLVQWKGWPKKFNSWEPISELVPA